MKARCTCTSCAIWEHWREEQKRIFSVLQGGNIVEEMHSSAAQRREELAQKAVNLNRLVNSLRHEISRGREELDIAQAEVESLETRIASMESELENRRQAKMNAEVVYMHYQVALERTNLALKKLREEKAAREAEAKARSKAEEKRVQLLKMEVARNSRKLKEDKAQAEAALDKCKEVAQLLACKGLLSSELEEELADMMRFHMKHLGSREVDSSSEVDASDEADLGGQHLEVLLAADERKSPERSLEHCFSAVAKMRVPRALSPLPPSPLLASRLPPSVASLTSVQLVPPLPAPPTKDPLPPVPEPSQLARPSEAVQLTPVLSPLLTKQGPQHEFKFPLSVCKAEQSGTEQDLLTPELPWPKKRRLAHTPTKASSTLEPIQLKNERLAHTPTKASPTLEPIQLKNERLAHTPTKDSSTPEPLQPKNERLAHTPSKAPSTLEPIQLKNEQLAHTPTKDSSTPEPLQPKNERLAHTPTKGSLMPEPLQPKNGQFAHAPTRNSSTPEPLEPEEGQLVIDLAEVGDEDLSEGEVPPPSKKPLLSKGDEDLSEGEVPPPSKKPLLSKHQVHELFSSDSSGEEDGAKEEKNSEQSPPRTCPPCTAERAATMGMAVSTGLVQGAGGSHGIPSCGPLHAGTIQAVPGYLPSQGTPGTCRGVVCSPSHVVLGRALSGSSVQVKEGQNGGMESNTASATTSKAASGNLASQGMLGKRKRAVCSRIHTVSKTEAQSGNPAQARKGQNVGIVQSPAPEEASKATPGSSSGGGQSLYSKFLCTKEHVAMSRSAVCKSQTSKIAQAVVARLAYFATQQEVPGEQLKECVQKVKCDQLVRGALNYLSECMANPVSAFCRNEQKAPLITKFESLLLQALAHKKNGLVTLLSALRARFWSRAKPLTLMGRSSYVRLIGAVCCKLNEPTVAHILIWDLLGTNQAPFLVASVVGAWPGLLRELPRGVLQKTVAYVLLGSSAHTLNSTLEFQAHKVLRVLGPLHGYFKYIPKQLAEELLAPLLSAHTCGDTCVMHHRALQELCQRSPESLLPWLLEEKLAPQAESLAGNDSTGCIIFLLVSLWKMYKVPPSALEPLFTQLLQSAKNKGIRSKHRHFLKWDGTREVLNRNHRATQEASAAEPPPQENA